MGNLEATSSFEQPGAKLRLSASSSATSTLGRGSDERASETSIMVFSGHGIQRLSKGPGTARVLGTPRWPVHAVVICRLMESGRPRRDGISAANAGNRSMTLLGWMDRVRGRCNTLPSLTVRIRMAASRVGSQAQTRMRSSRGGERCGHSSRNQGQARLRRQPCEGFARLLPTQLGAHYLGQLGTQTGVRAHARVSAAAPRLVLLELLLHQRRVSARRAQLRRQRLQQ